MAKICITTDEGIIIGEIDTADYDLDKSVARGVLCNEVVDLIKEADNYTE